MHDHDYPRIGIPAIPDHLEYADDVDFLFTNDELADKAIMIIKQTLKNYNLQLNESKTEKIRYTRDCNLRKVKKLGTILDEGAEINRRKQLASLAMSKYRRIWRNKYITVRRKVKIYNVYVRSIFLYNCSTWTSNKATEKSLNSFHRRQLKQCLNIKYPKVIKKRRVI